MKKLALFVLLLLSTHYGWAIECSDVFPSVVQSHSSSGKLTVNNGAQIINSPSTVLPFVNSTINAKKGDSCETAECSVSGNPAGSIELPTFASFSGGSDATLTGGTLGEGSYAGNTFQNVTVANGVNHFSGSHDEYFISNLSINKGTLTLRPGIYWIKNINLNSNGIINVEGEGTAYLYIASTLNTGSNSAINGINSDAVISLNVYADVSINSNSDISALLYAEGEVNVASNSSFTGAMSSSNLTLHSNSTVTYNSNLLDDYEFTELCGSEVPQQVGFYQFEQDSWPNAGDVLDSSSSSNHGTPLGNISPFLDSATQKSCQALAIDNNTSSSVINAVDTGIDINSLGEDGTISFWYRSNNSWSGGGNRQLIDASSRSAGNKYFFLVLRSNGSLRFGLEYSDDDDLLSTTSNYSFAANEWVHIAVTWNPLAAELELYVNGSKANTTDSIETPAGGALDELGNLYIGDNSTSYAVNGSTSNSANGYFDDVRVYNFIQTQSAIETDMQDVSACQSEPLAYYPFEDIPWSVGDNISDASGTGNDATSLGDVQLLILSSQISCQLLDVPFNNSQSNTDVINSGLDVNDIGNNGTISFWYRSNESWDDNSERQLFDASNDALSDNKHFYLALNAGTLEFGIEDKDDRGLFVSLTGLSYAAQEWVFIAVTWDMQNKQVQLYVQQLDSQQSASNTRNNLVDELGDMDTLYFGDSRSGYFANTTLSTANSANGQFDNIRIYNVTQSQAQISEDSQEVTACAVLDHYRIEHTGQGFTCEAAPITIKACANDDCSLPYDQSTSITLLPSGWNGDDTLTVTDQLQTSLSITAAGTETFSQTASTPNAPLRCFKDGIETCDIEFVETGFKFIGATKDDSPASDYVAETDFVNVQIMAIETPEGGGACQAAVAGELDVTFGYDCTEPDTCLTEFVEIDGKNALGITTALRKLTFNADGIASLGKLYYADAGRISLSVSATVGGATLKGNESFDVYPDYLQLQVIGAGDADLSYTGVSANNNYMAGQNFTFTLGAYGRQNNPLPNYEALNLEMRLARIRPLNSGQNGIFEYSETGTLTSDTISEFNSVNKSTLSFSGGIHRHTGAYYSEVGRIEIDARDADYLGNIIESSGTLTLGDFYPAFFEVAANVPTLTNSCNVFSYIGQELTFDTVPLLTLTAKNALGITTQNYASDNDDGADDNDNFWNFAPNESTLNSNISYTDTSYSALSFVDLGDTPAVTNSNGVGAITIPNRSFRYDKVEEDGKPITPKSPFDASINLEFTKELFTVPFTNKSGVTTNVCFKDNHASNICKPLSINLITGANLRYGRLALESTYGPETEPLNAPIKAEYYKTGQWLLNTDDSCTSIAFDQSANHINLLPSGDTNITGDIDNNIASTGMLLMGVADNSFDMLLNAPNKAGNVKLQLDPVNDPTGWSSYLNYDWNGDGTICNQVPSCPDGPDDDNLPDLTDYPTATITFGQFRGNDRIIHWREVFN